MPEKYNYYREEMKRVLPIDQYGISIQIKTATGSTKWLALNAESLQIFNEVIVPVLPVPLGIKGSYAYWDGSKIVTGIRRE